MKLYKLGVQSDASQDLKRRCYDSSSAILLHTRTVDLLDLVSNRATLKSGYREIDPTPSNPTMVETWPLTPALGSVQDDKQAYLFPTTPHITPHYRL
jgi:hypothetical protein